MRELADLLKRLVAQRSLPQRTTMILEWTRSSLAVDGITPFERPVRRRAATVPRLIQ